MLLVQSCLAATVPTPPSLSLSLVTSLNLILPSNSSDTENGTLTYPSNRHLPSDPFTYLIPHTHIPDADDIIITFYHYGPLLAKSPIYTVITEALRDVNAHSDDREEVMGTKERWYDSAGDSHVVLLLHPGRDMEWYAWGQALRGLFWFMGEFDGVELVFDVFERDGDDGVLHLQGTGGVAR